MCDADAVEQLREAVQDYLRGHQTPGEKTLLAQRAVAICETHGLLAAGSVRDVVQSF